MKKLGMPNWLKLSDLKRPKQGSSLSKIAVRSSKKLAKISEDWPIRSM